MAAISMQYEMDLEKEEIKKSEGKPLDMLADMTAANTFCVILLFLAN